MECHPPGANDASTSHHWVFDQWTEEFLKKKYMAFTADGRMQSMALYYDPEIDHLQAPNPIMGLALLVRDPPNRPLAEMTYEAAIYTGMEQPRFPGAATAGPPLRCHGFRAGPGTG